MKKNGWLDYIGDFATQLYRDSINHCKDLYQPMSIMESHKGLGRYNS